MANFHAPDSLGNFQAVIVSSVPLGGGVSSSASLEVWLMKGFSKVRFRNVKSCPKLAQNVCCVLLNNKGYLEEFRASQDKLALEKRAETKFHVKKSNIKEKLFLNIHCE